MSEVLFRLVSDTYSTLNCLEILLYLVRNNIFMIWKVFLLVILDLNPLRGFGLMLTWIVVLQIKFRITSMRIITIIYEVTLVSLWCVNAFWGNYAQIIW